MDIDWQKYGLAGHGAAGEVPYQVYSSQTIDTENGANLVDHELARSRSGGGGDELFHDDQEAAGAGAGASAGVSSLAWLRANFFLAAADQRSLFGTWNGVFTSIVLNVFGVLIFLRAGWMVANAGILASTAVILLGFLISVVSISSGIVLCKKSKLTSDAANVNGGVFHLLSYALGVRVAVTVGLFYCFGQAVSSSLSLAAFGESLCQMLGLDESLTRIMSRLIGSLLMLFLLGVNLAGVKWIIRLQIALLVFIVVSVFDFVIGSFTHTNPALGVTGYSKVNFMANLYSNYSNDQSLFSIYGIFLPSMTGIFSGVNMAADLRTPELSIPVGTYTGVTACTLVYVLFIIIFGCVATRDVLYTDFLIGEKISSLGSLFMAGLYICSISSSMGSFYGPSRLLQSMAKQNFLPKLFDPLKNDHGSSKIPVQALLVISFITLLFILIGQINILAPIVCMPYMLIYGAVNYACFAIMFKERREGNAESGAKEPAAVGLGSYVEIPSSIRRAEATPADVLLSPGSSSTRSADDDTDQPSSFDQTASPASKSYGSVGLAEVPASPPASSFHEPGREAEREYAWDWSNKWVSLFGALLSVVSMLVINYIYALVSIVVCALLYLNLRVYRPGLPKGVANLDLFNNAVLLLKSAKKRVKNLGAANPVYEMLNKSKSGQTKPEFVVVSQLQSINFSLQESQITEANEDYGNRKPYHHFNQGQLHDQIFK